MHEQIDTITIIGGGTAGWLTASFLITGLNRGAEDHKVGVTLIESPNIPTVGVGEATVPGMPRLLNQLGIDEAEFFRRTNASFKLGVRFSGWNTDAAGNPRSFIHPFNGGQYIRGWNPAYYYNKFGRAEFPDGTDGMVANPAVIDHMKGPKMLDAKSYEATVGYAYHLDAKLFAELLQEIAVARGVRHIRDDLDGVELDEDGNIATLQLRERGAHPVELVIDCTGFRGILIKDALGEPFEALGQYLLNDRALAVQIPHQDPTALEPCTRSTALGAGWAWRVPLFNRVGTGYVFSSAFRTDEQAIDEFMGHLGPQAEGYQPRAIAMRVGRSRRSWVKNCLAIGLSGGFIEPLESTAIFMIEMGIRWLLTYLPDKWCDPALARKFNSLMETLYAEVRDFIVLHYYLSNRQEPYWQAARAEIELPDSLKENLDLWRYAIPSVNDPPSTFLFNNWSYIFVLYGKGYFDGVNFPLEGALNQRDWQRYADRLTQIKRSLVQDLPGHHGLLSAIRDGGEPGAFTPPTPASPTVPLPLRDQGASVL